MVSERCDVNPRLTIPRPIFDTVDLWLDMRLHAEKGGHFLPEAGGMLAQPAALMDAFGILDRAMERKTGSASEGDAG